MFARRAALALAFTAPAGCAWGLRAGPEVLAYTNGPVLVQGGVTGVLGFGSTHRDGTVSDGIVTTVNLSAGGDVRGGGGALSGAFGLAWFSLPEVRRLGWFAGFEVGGRGRGEGSFGPELLVGLRGGPHLRLLSRDAAGGRLVTLGFDLTAQGALPDGEGRHGAFVAGLAVTVGFMNVRYFHL